MARFASITWSPRSSLGRARPGSRTGRGRGRSARARCAWKARRRPSPRPTPGRSSARFAGHHDSRRRPRWARCSRPAASIPLRLIGALQWCDCCGFFVKSIADVPRDATPSGRSSSSTRCRAIGLGSIRVTPRTATCWSTTRPSTRRRARPSRRSASRGAKDRRPKGGTVDVHGQLVGRRGHGHAGRRRLGAGERDRHTADATGRRDACGSRAPAPSRCGRRAPARSARAAVGARPPGHVLTPAMIAASAAGGTPPAARGLATVQVSVTRGYGATHAVGRHGRRPGSRR